MRYLLNSIEDFVAVAKQFQVSEVFMSVAGRSDNVRATAEITLTARKGQELLEHSVEVGNAFLHSKEDMDALNMATEQKIKELRQKLEAEDFIVRNGVILYG